MISVSIGSPPTRASDRTDTLSIVYNAFLCRTEEHSACMFIVSLGIKNCRRCGIGVEIRARETTRGNVGIRIGIAKQKLRGKMSPPQIPNRSKLAQLAVLQAAQAVSSSAHGCRGLQRTERTRRSFSNRIVCRSISRKADCLSVIFCGPEGKKEIRPLCTHMRFSILHISDLHSDLTDEIDNKWLLDSLNNDFNQFEKQTPTIARPSLSIVSGDFIFGSNRAQRTTQESRIGNMRIQRNFLLAWPSGSSMESSSGL
jgi:hypothetical protein